MEARSPSPWYHTTTLAGLRACARARPRRPARGRPACSHVQVVVEEHPAPDRRHGHGPLLDPELLDGIGEVPLHQACPHPAHGACCGPSAPLRGRGGRTAEEDAQRRASFGTVAARRPTPRARRQHAPAVADVPDLDPRPRPGVAERQPQLVLACPSLASTTTIRRARSSSGSSDRIGKGQTVWGGRAPGDPLGAEAPPPHRGRVGRGVAGHEQYLGVLAPEGLGALLDVRDPLVPLGQADVVSLLVDRPELDGGDEVSGVAGSPATAQAGRPGPGACDSSTRPPSGRGSRRRG